MTKTLIRWRGSIDPADQTGTATFYAAGRSVDLHMPSFATDRELASLFEDGQKAAATQARRAAVAYLRGAATQLENDVA